MSSDNVLTRGLTVRDNSGNIILAAGNPLNYTNITAASGWLNSNVSINSDGTLSGAGSGQVTISGLDNTVVRSANPINTGNVSTYIGAGAIGNAYIGNFIQSGNFNGTIDSSGNITNYGTTGWAIGKGGSAALNSALFRGDIQTSGDAVFEGRTATSFQANIGGSNYYIDYSSLSNGLTAATSGYIRGGVVGYAYSTTSAWNVGVIGVGRNNGTTPGIGIVGQGDLIGGYFSSSNAGGATVQCNNLAGGPALQIVSNRAFVWNNYSIPAPTGS